MPRVKRGTIANKKRKAVLKHTKGYKWGRKSKERAAKEALLHAWSNKFRSRKEKKRVYRRLWQAKINAASRQHDMSYSKFMGALKEHNVGLDRKVLADIAEHEPSTFAKIVETVKK